MGTNRKPRRGVELGDWVAARDRAVEAQHQPRISQKPLTRNHLRYLDAIESSSICFCVGPAGTGKTVLACSVAVRLLRERKIDQIVLTRPLVTCDEELGLLPGTEVDKMTPYLVPLVRGLCRYMSPAEYDTLSKKGVVTVASLAAMRGMTFERAVVVVDEAENCTYRQLRMVLTRLGEGTRIVVNGDISQADIAGPRTNPLGRVILRLRGNSAVKLVKMTRADGLRPELVQWVDERLAGGEDGVVSCPGRP